MCLLDFLCFRNSVEKLTKNVRSLPIFVRSRILESVIVRMCYHCK